jgi:hypothetical protein
MENGTSRNEMVKHPGRVIHLHSLSGLRQECRICIKAMGDEPVDMRDENLHQIYTTAVNLSRGKNGVDISMARTNPSASGRRCWTCHALITASVVSANGVRLLPHQQVPPSHAVADLLTPPGFLNAKQHNPMIGNCGR